MKSVSLPTKLAPPHKPHTDIVGLELGCGLADGVPAVRLRKRDGVIELLAAGFLHLPGTLPDSPDFAPTPGTTVWTLPRPFQAPHAAIAVTSKLAFFRQSAGAAEEGQEKKQVAYRQAARVVVPDQPPFTAGLPEFQAAWAARLLPEGRPPTACSLQVSVAAAMSGFLPHPAFVEAGGNAVTLFVFANHTALAAFQDFRLVLYREHPIGADHLRNAISSQMHMEIGLADAVLEDTLIDPTPIIEPVLRPLFRQVEISADYLLRRRNCPVKHFFVCGLTAGSRYWSAIFAHMMSQPLTPCLPLDGIRVTAPASCLPKDLNAAAPLLMTAIGAARAVLEDL
ncbi:MAG TPA: hypothetical protein PKM57_15910 [Kiritimatiellia bacterium]|nr:hypothetical protein [Kiritimatiellia bacterium]HPS07397.1 hypothetical protein [Kiritimatiellia bacterium]